VPVARNSPLRFGAIALGQQVDMWLLQSPNLLRKVKLHISPKTLAEIPPRSLEKGGKYG